MERHIKVGALADILSPFSHVSDRSALSTTYKSLELSSDFICGCSTFAKLQARLTGDNRLGLDEVVYVDTAAFVALIKSLPDQEIIMEAEKGVLHWECGHANGHMANLTVDNMPSFKFPKQEAPLAVDEEICRAFELGTLSCNQSIGNAGLYGVVIENKKRWRIGSTDNTTLSLVDLGPADDQMPERLTIPPEGAELLSALMNPSDDGEIDITDDHVLYKDKIYDCLVKKQGVQIKYDLAEMYSHYTASEHTSKLQKNRINAFIRRVGALGQNRNEIEVKMGAKHGGLVLSFDDGTSSSTEYIVSDGEDKIPDIEAVPLLATALARVLSNVDTIVLDHLERGILVLRGSKPKFAYMISAVEG